MSMVNNNQIKVAGADPSLNNWGLAIGILDLDEGWLEITETHLIQPTKGDDKKLSRNIRDVLISQELYKQNMHLLSEVDIVFAELPIGSQSARAMASYGICLGVMGSLINSLDVELIRVTPMDVKKVVGNNTPSKLDMIDWAIDEHPEANFPMHTKKGINYITASKAEHMADAIAAIHAGIRKQQFLNLLKEY